LAIAHVFVPGADQRTIVPGTAETVDSAAGGSDAGFA
jgi:hypothetical protein